MTDRTCQIRTQCRGQNTGQSGPARTAWDSEHRTRTSAYCHTLQLCLLYTPALKVTGKDEELLSPCGSSRPFRLRQLLHHITFRNMCNIIFLYSKLGSLPLFHVSSETLSHFTPHHLSHFTPLVQFQKKQPLLAIQVNFQPASSHGFKCQQFINMYDISFST